MSRTRLIWCWPCYLRNKWTPWKNWLWVTCKLPILDCLSVFRRRPRRRRDRLDARSKLASIRRRRTPSSPSNRKRQRPPRKRDQDSKTWSRWVFWFFLKSGLRFLFCSALLCFCFAKWFRNGFMLDNLILDSICFFPHVLVLLFFQIFTLAEKDYWSDKSLTLINALDKTWILDKVRKRGPLNVTDFKIFFRPVIGSGFFDRIARLVKKQVSVTKARARKLLLSAINNWRF